MSISIDNLYDNIAAGLPDELFTTLLECERFRLERIVSRGQRTPPGKWYDQEEHEWVLLLSGSAGLWFEGEDSPRVLRPGDYVNIPAHCRHRVAWTAPDKHTLWLALHYF